MAKILARFEITRLSYARLCALLALSLCTLMQPNILVAQITSINEPSWATERRKQVDAAVWQLDADFYAKITPYFFAKDTLWSDFEDMLKQAGRTDESFYYAQIFYLSGRLRSEAELLSLVNAYEGSGQPFQAAKLLEREMNAGRIENTNMNRLRLVNWFFDAREHSRAYALLLAGIDSNPSREWVATAWRHAINEERCEDAEIVLIKGANYLDKSKNYDVGLCYLNDAPRIRPPDCWHNYSRSEGDPEFDTHRKARAVFARVPQGYANYEKSQSHIGQIDDKLAGIIDSCYGRKRGVWGDLCFQSIKQSYHTAKTDGTPFSLTVMADIDPNECALLIPQYDSLYRAVK